ncbi:alpha-1,3/1,6-mannosyltransferase ALG2-like [Harmonia axyridis]|uniref:alpha-1,3/1,6-mannosyltransferase ALG2-like n=1 Tax=Harmonia axyridis TaxID=115357 RepID=UPI001E275DFE|nr:alpha-1,3/1,6-mannosyltransferase ALG2-like [Harmonia axyridis]
MDFNVYRSDSEVNEPKNHDIIILHDRIARRREDRYIVNFAQCLESSGYQVTLVTSEVDEKNNCLDDIKLAGNIKIEKRVRWIPRHFFGFLRSTLSTYRGLCLALSLLLKSPSKKPCVVLMDVDLIALFALKMLSRFKVFYIEQFRSLRNPEACYDHVQLIPNLFEARWVKLADEVIVESPAFVDIFRRSFPSAVEPKVMIPLVDYGLWIEPGININRIIPDLSEKSVLFVALGKFRRNSNFKLVLDSFEEMLLQSEDSYFKQRAHLIVAGNCRANEERKYYQMFVERLKRRWFAAQVTVLRQIPTIHTKTLLIEASVVLHTSRNDICSDYLLEAMSLGKPIVAVNKGIASKVLENRITGVLVEPQPHLFAAAMMKVASSPHIKNFLGEMAKDAFNHKYSFDSFARRMYNLVQRHVLPLERIMATEKNEGIR